LGAVFCWVRFFVGRGSPFGHGHWFQFAAAANFQLDGVRPLANIGWPT
jgi:hypothetical protein